jgi:pyrimidine operon attenuation protein/uracil phosphoribosyltransferase
MKTELGEEGDASVVVSDLDAESLYRQLAAYVQTMLLQSPTHKPWHLIGIASGGAWIAQRLAERFGITYGVISSSLHRDDFAQRGLSLTSIPPMQTQLPFAISEAQILLIDDVLFTGRTIRAVLNELYDYGRPAAVRLAVLVDRGGRELPISADFASITLDSDTLRSGQTLQLQRKPERAQTPFLFVLDDSNDGVSDALSPH